MKNIILFLFICILTSTLTAAKVADKWTVFGPYSNLEHVLPQVLSNSIPNSLRASRVPRKAIEVTPINGKIDFQKIYNKKYPRKGFYVCIPITSTKGETIKIGAGADWWMDIYLNGKAIGDTLAEGNITHPPTSSDHIYKITLKPGKNYLVIGVIGGVGSQQLTFGLNPKVKKGAKSPHLNIQLGQEKLPPLKNFAKVWTNGPKDNKFLPKEITLNENMLRLTPIIKGNNSKRFTIKLNLEPGKQYCFNWSSLTRKGTNPVFLIQEKADGGKVYFAKELTNGRNRNGYFYAENPEPYAVLELRGNSITEINKLSLRRRIDRSVAFQDWRLQRFPAPKEIETISRQVKTDHFDQATKIQGGTLKLFHIGSFWGQRNLIEMEQRFDVLSDGIFTNGHAGTPLKYWVKNEKGQAVLKEEEKGILRAAKADCIIIDNCGASALTQFMRKRIAEEVKRGAGLVICGFDQPYYPYKDGRGKAAIAKMRSYFAYALDNKDTKDTDFVRITAAGNLDAEFGSFGKGRVVLLKSADNVKGKDRNLFEIRSALIGKAMLWATKRVPKVKLIAAANKEVITADIKGNSSKKLNVKLLAGDQYCKKLFSEEQIAKTNKITFTKKVNKYGKNIAIVTSSLDGVSQDWDIVFVGKQSSNILKNLTIKTHAPMIRCLVSLAIKPTKSEIINIKIEDRFGNLWLEKNQYAKENNLVYIKADNFNIPAAQLIVSLLDNKNNILDQQTTRVILHKDDDPKNPNFNLGVWGVPVNHYSAMLFYEILRDKYHLQFMLSGNHIPQAWEMLDLGIISAPNGVSGQINFGQNNKVIGTEDAPARELCLSSKKLKKHLQNRINWLLTRQKGMPAKYYFSDHETNLLGYIRKAKPGSDYCFSPTCIASLHELLKKEYKTIANINKSWGTKFTKWSEVTGIVLKNAVKNGQAARWIDHRRNMDKVWTDLTVFRINEIRKYNPTAIGYIQNLHSAYTSNDSFSGIDYEQLLNCNLGAGAMPESYINAFTKPENRIANSQGGSMWPPCGGLVDDPKLSSIRSSRVVWQSMLLGQQNCLYYLHNWNSHGIMLFNDIFMVYPDLTISPEGKALANAMTQAKTGVDRLLLSSKPDDSGIAMLYSRSSEHACTYWQAVNAGKVPGTANPRYQQFEFFVPAIDEAFRGFSSTSSSLIQAGALEKNNTKLLILPFAQSIQKKDAQIIREFVKNGGILLADFRPAVTDEHGVFGTKGLLDDVFGINQKLDWKFKLSPSKISVNYKNNKYEIKSALVGNNFDITTAKALGKTSNNLPVLLENNYGKGKAILLNFTTNDDAFKKFFAKLLNDIKIPELFICRNLESSWYTDKGMVKSSAIKGDKVTTSSASDFDKSATEDAGERETLVYETSSRPKLHRLTNGTAEIIGYYACRRGFSLGQGVMKLEYKVRKAGHIYDLLTNKYLGKTSTWKTTMPLEAVGIYAVLPFKAVPPQVTIKEIKRSSNKFIDVKVNVKLNKDGAKLLYPVKISFTSPNGKEFSRISKTLSVQNGSCDEVFTLPANAQPGEWTLSAREAFGGNINNIKFKVTK